MKTPRLSSIRGVRLSQSGMKLIDDADRFVDVVMGFIDVIEGALLQALRKRVVFFPCYVVVGLVNKLEGPV
jgi:hypothetical protein